MKFRRELFPASFAALLIFAAGCGNSESAPKPQPKPEAPAASKTFVPQKADSISRIHWLGKKRIAAEPGAAHFMAVWNLAESARLEEQTLRKLSTVPGWKLQGGRPGETNAVSGLLEPLLRDLVNEEFYFEARTEGTNGESVLAVRLGDERAAAWASGIKSALESLTGLKAAASDGGFSLKKHRAPNLIELSRAGGWTLVGCAQEKNGLMADFVGRIARDKAPFKSGPTNFWLDADVDARQLAGALPMGWVPSHGLPRVAVTVTSEGGDVRSRGMLTFDGDLGIKLDPWQIPTNLIREPLIGFTAVRGVKPWLGRNELISGGNPGGLPNQMFVWSLGGIQLQSYVAAPWPDAGNKVMQMGDRLVAEVNPWLAEHGMGTVEKSPGGGRIAWTAIPFMTPNLTAVRVGGVEYAYAGLFPAGPTNRPAPHELMHEVVSRENLVAYDWEISAPRTESWINICQLMRLVLGRGQLPAQSAGVLWLGAASPQLGNSATAVTKTGENQLSFTRRSTLGLTSLEMQMLVDWLESPRFPEGLHTSFAPSELRRHKKKAEQPAQ